MTVTYYIEGSKVTYNECLDYFIMYSGFSKDDAVRVFNDNNNSESAEYLTQECSEIEVIYN